MKNNVLKSLSLGGAYIDSDQSDDNLDFLSTIDKLEELNISSWQLGSSTWLAHLQNLRVLDLSYTDFVDSALLRNMTQITNLDLSETPMRSLNGLMDMLKK